MNAILAVAAVVALVWGIVLFRRGGLLSGCLAVVLAGCCFGHPFFNLPAGPIPITADRLLWVALLIMYLIWWRKGLTDPKRPDRAELVLIAFLVVLVLSTFAHDWRANHTQPVSRLLFYYLMPFGVYWVARRMALSERALVGMFVCLAGFGAYLALTAVAEVYQLWWAVFPKYIASTEFAEFYGRARGPLLNPTGNGLLLGTCLVGTLLLWPRANRAGKAGLVLLASLICLGIYCTLTRSVWMGAGAGLLIYLALTLPRAWRKPVLIGSLTLVAAVGITQWERLLVFKRDKALSAQEAAESVKLRPILAMVAWNMFLDRPLDGCGFGQYRNECIYYLRDRSTDLPLEKARRFHQHNVVLCLLVETGLIGAGLFLLVLLLWTRDAWLTWRSPHTPEWVRPQAVLLFVVMINYVTSGMFQDTSIVSMANMVLFFMAGVTSGLKPRVQAPAVGSRTANGVDPSRSDPCRELIHG